MNGHDDTATDEGFLRYERLMRAAGQPELAIEVFRHNFEQLASGATGLMPEASLLPLASLPDAEALGAYAARGVAELDRLVVVKLNGGLGTSMGMEQAKSLLPVKDGRAFIDLIAEQIVHLRAATGARLPLVLMDSFRTQADTRAALDAHAELIAGQTLPLSFLQHQVPKVLVDGFGPAAQGALADPELGWCPPGHGDLYPALATSGMLSKLLADGYRWAFVSNADNLGATPDATALGILGWMAEHEKPFVMECADRTAADRKGGHLAQDLEGRLVLREVAQCPGEDVDAFQDIERHRYFNTNNLWIDLVAVQAMLDERGGRLGLPLIRNKKSLDPTDTSSAPVYQLETAMGAAIALMSGAGAVRVPRSRFVPVKTTNDLLVLWSDVYVRTPEGDVRAVPERADDLPLADLDPHFYKNIDDFRARIAVAPSLICAIKLTVRGDVHFGAGVVVHGTVTLDHAGPEPLLLSAQTLAGETI